MTTRRRRPLGTRSPASTRPRSRSCSSDRSGGWGAGGPGGRGRAGGGGAALFPVGSAPWPAATSTPIIPGAVGWLRAHVRPSLAVSGRTGHASVPCGRVRSCLPAVGAQTPRLVSSQVWWGGVGDGPPCVCGLQPDRQRWGWKIDFSVDPQSGQDLWGPGGGSDPSEEGATRTPERGAGHSGRRRTDQTPGGRRGPLTTSA